MTLYYSAATGGFYDSHVHDAWPDDAVEITASQHQALLNANAEGQLIMADAKGRPVAVDPPPLEPHQLLERMRLKRDERLLACDYLMMPDYPIEAALRSDWAAYRQALRDMPENTADLTNIIWPEPPTTGQR